MEKSKNLGAISMGMKIFREISVPVAIFLAMFASTLVKVPFYPVPFTLQTLALPLICLFSSRKHALRGVALFAIHRIILVGPEIFLTIGYIIGFFAMAWILTSKAKVRPMGTARLLAGVMWTQFIVLLLGAAVLSLSIGLKRAFVCGFLFFVPAEVLKAAIVAGIYSLAAPRVENFPVER
jgi:biotin transport system substrate-specific component